MKQSPTITDMRICSQVQLDHAIILRSCYTAMNMLTSWLNGACRDLTGFSTLKAGRDESKTTSCLSIGIWRIMTSNRGMPLTLPRSQPTYCSLIETVRRTLKAACWPPAAVFFPSVR